MILFAKVYVSFMLNDKKGEMNGNADLSADAL